MRKARALPAIFVAATAGLLGGCNLVVMNPSGDVAQQQSELIIYSTVLMLIVILPVILLTLFFAFYYRSSNKSARYEPEWSHSISLEIVIWSVPLAIIICLAGLTWVATHRLNPYDPLRRISAEQPIDESVKPMLVQVVALDWKWLFIYPEYGVASVNQAAAIVDRPIEFQITSTTVMNSFYVPALAGMIYAMPGMQTELNAVFNEDGTYDGFSSNYSGAGFSQMRFTFDALDADGFDEWVKTVKTGAKTLDRDTFISLDQPSIDHPVTYYNGVEDGLWDLIVNLCTDHGTLCQNDMMMVDALGGGGLDGLFMRTAFAGICSADDAAAFLALVKPSARDRSAEIYAAIDRLPDFTQGRSVTQQPQAAN
ncbi:MAG: ubiquinol oxidase subunit II [Pseudomonadota bacterium]